MYLLEKTTTMMGSMEMYSIFSLLLIRLSLKDVMLYLIQGMLCIFLE
jgi:hypothetical protein